VLIGESDAAASEAFADDIVAGLAGSARRDGSGGRMRCVRRKWKELTGRDCRLRVRLRQHVLTAVSDVPAAPGAPRIATAADSDWLIEKQIAFIDEVGMPDPPERLREVIPPRVERGDFRIWEDDGPVAYAGFNDAAPDFARIAPVYTLPGHRGKGYATSLVAALSRELKGRGKRKLFLTTDIANPTSNAIYARIGFRPENDDCGFDFIAPGA
jgi:predicted GNAT family acetyltransferase